MADSSRGVSIVKFIIVAGVVGVLGVAYFDDEQNSSKPKDPAEDDAGTVLSAAHAAACGDLGPAIADAVLQKAIDNAQARAKASGTDPQNQIDHLHQKEQDGAEYARTGGCSGIFAPVEPEALAMAFILSPAEGVPSDTASEQATPPPPMLSVTSIPAGGSAGFYAVVPPTLPSSPVPEAPGTPTNQPAAETDEHAVSDPSMGQTSAPAQTSLPEQPEKQNSPDQPTANANPLASNNAPQKVRWYYCDPARAYFPYVQRCPVPWRAVIAGRAAGTVQVPVDGSGQSGSPTLGLAR